MAACESENTLSSTQKSARDYVEHLVLLGLTEEEITSRIGALELAYGIAQSLNGAGMVPSAVYPENLLEPRASQNSPQ